VDALKVSMMTMCRQLAFHAKSNVFHANKLRIIALNVQAKGFRSQPVVACKVISIVARLPVINVLSNAEHAF
jgi:hypothetical protein